jgi:hypothetical protein
MLPMPIGSTGAHNDHRQEHMMHYSEVRMDVKERHIACSRDHIVTVNSTLVSSEMDHVIYTHQGVKAYTWAYIQPLQSTAFGHMSGVGPRQNYLKLEKRPDPTGGRERTEAHCS